MIQKVENLSADLEFKSLVETPHLGDREVPILKRRPAEDIASGVAKRPEGWSCEYGSVLHVAAVVWQHIDRGLAPCFLRCRNALGVPAVHIPVVVSRKIVDERDRRCSRPVNIVRASRNVPTVLEYPGRAVVIAEVNQRVRLAALQCDDTVHLPSLQHLEF